MSIYEYKINISVRGSCSGKDLDQLHTQFGYALEEAMNGLSDNVLGHFITNESNVTISKITGWLEGWNNP